MDPTLERALTREIESLLGGPLDARRSTGLGRALASLHARFISDDAAPTERAPYLADKASLAAYLAYFFPASMAQVSRVFAEMEPPNASTVRVLDVGAGPGPAGFAAAAWLHARGRGVALTALDVSSDALSVLTRIWPKSWGSCTTRTWTAGTALPAGPFDLIVASHSVNELFVNDAARLDRRVGLVESLSETLATGGRIVIVEPALKRTGRELLEMRDRLVSKGFSILAPCLRQATCPALERPRDWCHADRPWEAPAVVDLAAKAAGLARESLKYSYLVIGKEPAPAPIEGRFRIVSEPLPEKGKLRFFGCGGVGRVPIVRLERERAESTAAFGELERGDVVQFDALGQAGDGLRVTASTTVQVVQSARGLDRGNV
jgi:ribosomal protein RSM22 (predicted rRNA methylase)